ncbi:MAG TPA: hypothetical protein VF043_18290 [Ktedonobacteraceae bacterium]
MCMSCGCGNPNDSKGDNRNITQDDLNNAAQAANITPEEAAQNIADASQQMSSGYSSGQSGFNQPWARGGGYDPTQPYDQGQP